MSQNDFNFPENLDQLKAAIKPIILGIIVLILIAAGFTSFYTVPAESQGVVLRFGKYLKTEDSGLRFKMPFGIDRVSVLPVRRQLKQEFGFATQGATNTNQYSSSRVEQEQERSMVTGDKNAASVEWVVQYRIRDPKLYLFTVRDPEETLRDVSESVMRTLVGDRTVDEVITIGRQSIEGEAKINMQEFANRYQLGLSIDLVQLRGVNPPPPVQPSFNRVNQAQQEREKLINQANGEYNKIIPRAKGRAEQTIQAAEGYALKRVNEAQGNVARFIAVYEEYLKAPEVTKRRLYLETMQTVVKDLDKKIIIDGEAKGILPMLQLNNLGGN